MFGKKYNNYILNERLEEVMWNKAKNAKSINISCFIESQLYIGEVNLEKVLKDIPDDVTKEWVYFVSNEEIKEFQNYYKEYIEEKYQEYGGGI
ncbi:hypothetical protein [Clostridium butyricum]|nr:hypothetical protein [Clostridium butyricum]KHD14002.1 hypothetical protein OA81_17925 [Clostridium butyricum]